MSLKEFFGQRNYFLLLVCAILAVLSGWQYDKQLRENALAAEQNKPVVKIGVLMPAAGSGSQYLSDPGFKNNYEFQIREQKDSSSASQTLSGFNACIMITSSPEKTSVRVAMEDGVVCIRINTDEKNISLRFAEVVMMLVESFEKGETPAETEEIFRKMLKTETLKTAA